jgi:hypothetical protein
MQDGSVSVPWLQSHWTRGRQSLVLVSSQIGDIPEILPLPYLGENLYKPYLF